MKTIGKDVYATDEAFPSVGRPQIESLKKELDLCARGRVRLCMHKTNEDRLHEMFIAFTGGSYVRPSRHLAKEESIHLLEGAGDYLFFDETGNVADTVPLGTYSSGGQFYCRIPESADHALFIRSPDSAVHESTVGPFKREDTVFAAWSPEEADGPGVVRFLEGLKRLPGKDRPLLKLQQSGEGVYVADEPIVCVGKKEIAFLKQKIQATQRKQVRLRAQKGMENTLQEAFVVYGRMNYLKPAKHLNNDESLHILEGEADCIFFDEQGKIIASIPLGDYNSGRQFYIRVPASVYHTMIMKSDVLVSHEVTLGPLAKADTVWAPWAPEETAQAGVAKFMDQLRSAGAVAA